MALEVPSQNGWPRQAVAGSAPPTSLILRAADGYSLWACLFEPLSAVAGTLVIHGATATRQRYYRRFAQFLTERGVRVVTYDYRGIGQSRPASLRGYRATMTEWADVDARSVHRHVRAQYGAQPIAILGHSFGGQLVGLIDEAREACGAIFVGAQLGYYGYWRGLQRIKMGMRALRILPVQLSRHPLDGCARLLA